MGTEKNTTRDSVTMAVILTENRKHFLLTAVLTVSVTFPFLLSTADAWQLPQKLSLQVKTCAELNAAHVNCEEHECSFEQNIY
jgi:hypothetical protein